MNWVTWSLAGFGLGAIAGSFVATIVIRWPQGLSAMGGRSHCDSCDRVLGPIDLIPLISFALRRGRCATCMSKIDPQHFVIELVAAVIGATAFGIAPGWSGVAGALFGWWLLALAALDLKHFWLPDRLTLPLIGLGLLAGLVGIDPVPIDRVAGAVVGFGTLWIVAEGYRLLRRRIGLGGGDPKLFGAIGAWLGWQALPWVLIVACCGGLGYVIAMALRRQPVDATTPLPFGTLLAAGAFAYWTAFSAGVLSPLSPPL